MLFDLFGASGIGLAWGWLIGQTMQWRYHPLFKAANVIGGTALISVQVFLYSSWFSVAFFFTAVGVAHLIHLEWLRKLTKTRIYKTKRRGGLE